MISILVPHITVPLHLSTDTDIASCHGCILLPTWFRCALPILLMKHSKWQLFQLTEMIFTTILQCLIFVVDNDIVLKVFQLSLPGFEVKSIITGIYARHWRPSNFSWKLWRRPCFPRSSGHSHLETIELMISRFEIRASCFKCHKERAHLLM